MSAATDPAEVLLRRAFDQHLETVMSTTDTERELSRFQDGLRRRSRRRWPAVAAASLIALGLAGAGAYALSTDDPPTGADIAAGGRALTGDLELVETERGQQPSGRSDQIELRGGAWTGSVDLVAAGTARTGSAALSVSGSYVSSATGPSVLHLWGTARLDLGDTTCTGPLGLSWYYDPAESGGSMHLLCEDGSALLATPVVTRLEPNSKDEWFFDLRLDGGTFIAG